MHDALKSYASVHKSGHSGGPTILNGENREFLSVSRARRESSSHTRRNNASAVPVSTFDDEWMSDDELIEIT